MARAIGAGGDPDLAIGRAGGVPDHALSGGKREYHVAGRHRDCDWRDGGCGHRDDRKCSQAYRTPDGRTPRYRHFGQGAVADRGRSIARSWPGAVFQPADHHAVVHSGIHPSGAGRAAVRAAGLYQNLCDGGGGDPFDHAGAGADRLAGARQDPARRQQHPQPRVDPRLSPRPRLGDAAAQGGAGDRRGGVCDHLDPRRAAGRRVPAADGRRRSALYADRLARPVTCASLRLAPAHRPDDQIRARSCHRVRQGGPRRYRHRPCPVDDV